MSHFLDAHDAPMVFHFTPVEGNGQPNTWLKLAVLGLTRIQRIDPLGTTLPSTLSTPEDSFCEFKQDGASETVQSYASLKQGKGGCYKAACFSANARTKKQSGSSSGLLPSAYRFDASFLCSASKVMEFYVSSTKQKQVNQSLLECDNLQSLDEQERNTLFQGVIQEMPHLASLIVSIDHARYMYIATKKPNSNYQDLDMIDFMVVYRLKDQSRLLVAVSAGHNVKPPSTTYRRSENEYRYVFAQPTDASSCKATMGISSHFEGMPQTELDTVASAFVQIFNSHCLFLAPKVNA